MVAPALSRKYRKEGCLFLCIVIISLPLFSFYSLGQVKAAPTAPIIQTIDANGEEGSYLSLALDSKGNPGISYYDFSNTRLKYAYWNGSWNIQVVDPNGFNGLHTSLAFDSADNPHIAYMAQYSLNYASWNGTNWNIQKVDSAGSFTSLVLDKNDYPHISYFSVQYGHSLKYAVWDGSSWNLQVIDSSGIVGEFTSLKLDSTGYPHISYYDITNKCLKLAWQDDQGWHIQVVDASGNVGEYTSLQLDSQGNSYISYYDVSNGYLKYAQSNGSSWNVQVVDSKGNVGTDSSLALDSSGNPHISYSDNTNHALKYASWTGTDWNIKTVPSAGYLGEYTSLPIGYTSLQIDKNNIAHIAYCDTGSYRLKYVTAPDAPGVPVQYVQPTATLSIGPNPVGVGQKVYIGMSITPPPPITLSDQFTGVTVSITNPDGTNNTFGPFISQGLGLLYMYYTPTQVGQYQVQCNYRGQIFSQSNITYMPAQSPVTTLNVQQQPVTPRTWIVAKSGPADFNSIRSAINASNVGDTIYVHSGVYREGELDITKPLTLIGENATNTLLDGDSDQIRLYVSNTVGVTVSGFAVQNCYGIYSAYSHDTLITNNIVSSCSQGIVLIADTNNIVTKNTLTNNTLALLVSQGSSNTISDNLITGNKGDNTIRISTSNMNTITGNYVSGISLNFSNKTTIFHNDIIGQAQNWMSLNSTWDNGYPSGGNYWSNYHGNDTNKDGIGDTPYIIDASNKDNYPLMNLTGNFNLTNIPTADPIPPPITHPSPPLTQTNTTTINTTTPIPTTQTTVSQEANNLKDTKTGGNATTIEPSTGTPDATDYQGNNSQKMVPKYIPVEKAQAFPTIIVIAIVAGVTIPSLAAALIIFFQKQRSKPLERDKYY